MKHIFITLLQEVLQLQVTDLHFQSKFQPIIYMRSKGEIRPLKEIPLDIYQNLMLYITYRGNIDLNRHQLPQTGTFSQEVDGRRIDLRLSYIPSQNDLHLVLRLLNLQNMIHFAQLTPLCSTKQKLRLLLQKDYGLIVVCGPTGSGKSTTLHAFLEEIAQHEHKSLVSIEDPIEMRHPGVVQIQIDEQNHLDFPTVLNQILRHDPDVVMVGEIRDETSAAIAMRLALTGHLILTTLHTFSVKGALARLLNLGISKDDLHDVLRGVVFQRLIYPKACPHGFCCFEIADQKQLATLMEQGEITYQTLYQNAIEAKMNGWLDEEEVQSLID